MRAKNEEENLRGGGIGSNVKPNDVTTNERENGLAIIAFGVIVVIALLLGYFL